MEKRTEVAHRLKDVCSRKGAKTARAAWLALGEKVEGKDLVVWTDRQGRERQVSYAAAKNYHSHSASTFREAPHHYLERVAEVFGCRFEWLSTGRGPQTDAEARVVEPDERSIEELVEDARARRTPADHIDDLFRTTRAGWLLFDESTRWRVAEVFGRWYEAHARQAEAHGQTTLDVPVAAGVFAELLARPVMHWYAPHLHGIDMHPDRITAYINAQLLAISLATPDGRDFRLPVEQRLDPAAALADLKRRQPPNELDLADLNRRIAEKENPDA